MTRTHSYFWVLAGLAVLALGCSGPEPKASSPKSAEAPPPAATTQEPVTTKTEFRPINAFALWPGPNELLLGTNETSQNNEVFALSLSDPYDDDADSLRFRRLYPNRVNSIVVRPDGKWAAMDEVGSSGPSLVVLMNEDFAGPVALLHGPEDYASLAFLPGGERLAMASGGEIYMVDLAAKRVVETWRIADNRFDVSTEIHNSDSGAFLRASWLNERPTQIYDLASKRPIRVPGLDKLGSAARIFRHRGSWLAFNGGKVIEIASGKTLFEEPGGSTGSALSPDGKLLAFRSPGGNDPEKRGFVVVDLNAMKVIHRFKPEMELASQDFGFLTNHTFVNPGGTLQLWDLRTGKTIAWIVPWAVTTYPVASGLTAQRRDWSVVLPDGRYIGSANAPTLEGRGKRRDPAALKDLRLALGLGE